MAYFYGHNFSLRFRLKDREIKNHCSLLNICVDQTQSAELACSLKCREVGKFLLDIKLENLNFESRLKHFRKKRIIY